MRGAESRKYETYVYYGEDFLDEGNKADGNFGTFLCFIADVNAQSNKLLHIPCNIIGDSLFQI